MKEGLFNYKFDNLINRLYDDLIFNNNNYDIINS